MSDDGSIREGLLALREEAAAFLPITGVGVARQDGDAVRFAYTDCFGTAGFRIPVADAPAPLRPPLTTAGALAEADFDARAGVVETLLGLRGFPGPVRHAFRSRRLLTVPIPAAEPMVLMLGTSDAAALTATQAESVAALAARAGALLLRAETPDEERSRLRRLEEAAALLPALFRVLDVREVFARVSALTRHVMPHDIMALGFFDEALTTVTAYAHTSPQGMPTSTPIPYPAIMTRAWEHNILDDLTTSPVEGAAPLTLAGGLSSLRIAIRLDDRVFGGLNFTSFERARYTSADLAIGRRIAEYVALALSHHRLAEDARQGEELRARASTHALLDDLLATVTDTGDLRDVFDRVSAVAQKVLPHDAVALPVLLPDGRLRVYASSGAAFPDVVEIPQALRKTDDWEYDLVPDLQADPDAHVIPPARLGYRASLRVPLKLGGRLAGALDFLSFTPSLYSEADLPVARRIADRVALALSRERRELEVQRADEAAARAAALESRVRALTEELNRRAGYHRVIGASPGWRQALTQAAQAAPTDTTVLLLGESGTGKEVVARFVHGASRRKNGPFVALNCAALPEHLLEAELFGYERGAFTGATQGKPGQIEQAAGGTLFLDEVAEMSPGAQAKFLRVLQEREFQRLGGTRVMRTDARVVAATNRDLARAIATGQFREDLYYRLNVFSLRLPPLRDRREDLLPLAEAFLSDVGRSLGRPPAGVSREARQALVEYHWPGNVRELRNVIERAAILADGGLIAAEHLALRTMATPAPASSALTAAGAPTAAPGPAPAVPAGDLGTVERAMIEQALRDARFNKSRAAKRLGLSRAQLYVRLKRHGLE
jgi:transcriptional regulator with GAF, ATPase, and Fis domain